MKQVKWERENWLRGGVLAAIVFAGVVYGQTLGGQAPARPTLGAATAAQSSSPGKVVLKVGDASVTQADVEALIQGLTPQAQNALARQGRRPLGDEYAGILLLSNEAAKHHLDSTPEFKQMMALHRLEILATLEHQEIERKSSVTPEEISSYYTAHQSDYSQCMIEDVVVRKRAEGAKEGTPGFSAEEAKSRAEEIHKAFVAGDNPKKVAEKFQVPNVVRVDSEPIPVSVREGSLRPDMIKAAYELKDGGVSEVFDVGHSLVFFKVVSHKQQELKEVSPQIEKTLQKQKLDGALEALKKKSNVWLDETYFGPPAPAGPRPGVRPEGQVNVPVTPR